MTGFAAGWFAWTVVLWIGLSLRAEEAGRREEDSWDAEKRAVSAGLLAMLIGLWFGWETRRAAGAAVSGVLLTAFSGIPEGGNLPYIYGVRRLREEADRNFSGRKGKESRKSAALFWLLYLMAASWLSAAGEEFLQWVNGRLPVPLAGFVGGHFWVYLFGFLFLEALAGGCFFLLGRGIRILCAQPHRCLLAIPGIAGWIGLLLWDFAGVQERDPRGIPRLIPFAAILFGMIVQALLRERKLRRELREKRLADQERHYQEAAAFYQAHARLYHDRENHLNLLYQILNDGDTEGAKRYIEKISRPVAEPFGRIYTGNERIDAVLGSKAAVMEKKKIPYDFHTEFPKSCGIDPDMLCLILGNLLDNAIEAVEAIPEEERRPVQLTLRKMRGFLILKQENPYRETEKKKTGAIHGWGLSNVDLLAARAGGTTEYRRENGEFISGVLLPWKG